MLRSVFWRISVMNASCPRINENQECRINVFNVVKHLLCAISLGMMKKSDYLLPFREIKTIFASRTSFLSAWETGAIGRMSGRRVRRKTG